MWFVYYWHGTGGEDDRRATWGPGVCVRGLEEGMPNVPPGHFEAVLTDGRKVRLKF